MRAAIDSDSDLFRSLLHARASFSGVPPSVWGTQCGGPSLSTVYCHLSTPPLLALGCSPLLNNETGGRHFWLLSSTCPISPVFADRITELHAEMQKRVESGQYHPRVAEATAQAKFPDVVRDRFKAACKAGLAMLQEYINNLARGHVFLQAPQGFRSMKHP